MPELSLFTEFRGRRAAEAQFCAEALNVFDHVQSGGLNTGVTDTNFGHLTTQNNSPRQLQFALKLLFYD